MVTCQVNLKLQKKCQLTFRPAVLDYLSQPLHLQHLDNHRKSISQVIFSVNQKAFIINSLMGRGSSLWQIKLPSISQSTILRCTLAPQWVNVGTCLPSKFLETMTWVRIKFLNRDLHFSNYFNECHQKNRNFPTCATHGGGQHSHLYL